MVRYAIDDITDDMILGESVFSPQGDLLLAAGYHVFLQYRKRLKELGYHTVLINVEGTESVLPETIISDHVQREMSISMSKSVNELQNVFNYKKITRQTVAEIITDNRNSLDKLIMNSGIAHALEKLMSEICEQSTVVLNLSVLDKANKEFFAHSLNVTIVALCLGRKFRFSYEELKQLGMGALNYDLGMAVIPKDLIEKPDPLNDDECKLLMQHTSYGHLMLSQNPAIPPTSAAVALQHHEHQDGSGYPRGMKGDNRLPIKDISRQNLIHRFAEIVAVADIYNMLTEGRTHYSQKFDVKTALKTVIAMSGKRLNAEIVKALITMVPIYPVGARVRVVSSPVAELSGYSGVVAKDNIQNLEEPQVVLFETRHRQKIKPILIDMTRHKGFVLELII